MKTVHGDVFQCNECEQTFLDGELLLNHRDTEHFGKYFHKSISFELKLNFLQL